MTVLMMNSKVMISIQNYLTMIKYHRMELMAKRRMAAMF